MTEAELDALDEEFEKRTPLQWGVDFILIPSAFLCIGSLLLLVATGAMLGVFKCVSLMLAMVG